MIPSRIILYSFFIVVSLFSGLIAEEKTAPEYYELASIEKMKEIDFALFLIQKRLSVTHEIARWKWNRNAEIEDPVHEQQLLKKYVKLATAYNLNKEWAVKFFQAQIDAAKMIESQDFDYWNSKNVHKHTVCADLHTEIRPYLDRLTKELLEALVKIAPYLEDKTPFLLEQPLLTRSSDLVDEIVWQQAIAPLCEYSS